MALKNRFWSHKASVHLQMENFSPKKVIILWMILDNLNFIWETIEVWQHYVLWGLKTRYIFFLRNQICNEIFFWLLYELHSPYDNVGHYDKLSFLRISENPRLRVNTFNDVSSEQWKRCSCVHLVLTVMNEYENDWM